MTFSKSFIDAHTRLCCIIGHPVSESLSPLMHNTAFQYLNLNYIYTAFDVDSIILEDAVRGLKTLGAVGFNVTIPHKASVMKYLDSVDNLAAEIGAVNTVVNQEGRLVGFNTDMLGIIEALKSHSALLKGSRALVIGAGGGGRACAYALLKEGCSMLIILNRTLSRASQLLRELKGKFSFEGYADGLDKKSIEEALRKVDLIFNATPIGMYVEDEECYISSEHIRPGMIVFDLVYKPLKTRLIRVAEEAGATVVYGYEMLVHQGAAAFKMWTGVDPPIDLMAKVVREALLG